MEERGQGSLSNAPCYYLEKFSLFETTSNFYLIGRDEKRKYWRVLKIGRSEPSELVIYEDPTIYSSSECKILLQDIDELNKLTGGHKFVTHCYGIVGFIRFLGPYYIVLITERREIGKICGNSIYGISKYKMIPLPYSTVWSYMDNFEKENRYKKLLCSVDITKDFFFSYSYPIMHSLQKNLKETRQSSNGRMFIWNEYLTRQIRDHLKNTLWTVALVHGFFKQVELSLSGKIFGFILIARRSCQFAGPRYQKRGVNGEGQAANDVEIEQIVFDDTHGECPLKITSNVQMRGSIPLPWSQKASWLKCKPDILLSGSNRSYVPTQLHFQTLCLRYGVPIFILDLVKKHEKKPREELLHREYRNAVESINMDLPKEDQLTFLDLDLNEVFRRRGTDVLKVLKDSISNALGHIGFYSGQIHQSVAFKASLDYSYNRNNSNCAFCQETNSSYSDNKSKHQKGILRTNCIDSLDRTNVAQYVYGLVSLGQQLFDLKILESPELSFNQALAYDVMNIFEAMGNALAQQYGGSAAHTKIFSKIRGQCGLATKICGFMTSVQRHFSNSFWDVDKQTAIDLFLGRFQPDVCESASMETNLGKKYNAGRRNAIYLRNASRSMLERSKSDSKVHYWGMEDKVYSSEISSWEDSSSNSRCTPYMSSGQLVYDHKNQGYGSVGSCYSEDADEFGFSQWDGSSRDYEHTES